MTNEQEFRTRVDRALTYRRDVRFTIYGALLAVMGIIMIFQPEIPWTAAYPMVTAGLIAVMFFGAQARLHKRGEETQR